MKLLRALIIFISVSVNAQNEVKVANPRINEEDKGNLVYINRFSELDSLNFSLSNIETLMILGEHLKTFKLDSNICRLKNLRFLDLDCYDIILDDIGCLDLLVRFSKSVGKPLKEVPSFVYEIENLSVLNVYLENDFSLSDSLENLKNLTNLILSFENLNEFPKSIYKLQDLKVLGITSDIVSIDSNITKLKRLKNLSVPILLDKNDILLLSTLDSLESLEVRKIKKDAIPYIELLYNCQEIGIQGVSSRKRKMIIKQLEYSKLFYTRFPYKTIIIEKKYEVLK